MNMSRKLLVAGAVVAALAVGFTTGLSVGQEKKMSGRIYELRTYTTLPGRLPALNKRFAEHTIKLFEKHGMKNGMYWVPTEDGRNARKENTLIYVVSHESQEAADKSWKAFSADPDWVKAREASEKDGKIVEKVERVFMTLTDYSPVK